MDALPTARRSTPPEGRTLVLAPYSDAELRFVAEMTRASSAWHAAARTGSGIWSLDTDPAAQYAQEQTGINMAALRNTDRARFLHLRDEAKRHAFNQRWGLPAAP